MSRSRAKRGRNYSTAKGKPRNSIDLLNNKRRSHGFKKWTFRKKDAEKCKPTNRTICQRCEEVDWKCSSLTQPILRGNSIADKYQAIPIAEKETETGKPSQLPASRRCGPSAPDFGLSSLTLSEPEEDTLMPDAANIFQKSSGLSERVVPKPFGIGYWTRSTWLQKRELPEPDLRSAYYCVRCWSKCKSKEVWLAHVRRGDCPTRPSPAWRH